MKNRLVLFLFLIFGHSNAMAKEYSCKDLPTLQSHIKKDGEIKSLSVSAQIIRLMGRNLNSCVKTVLETTNAAEIQYLDDKIVSSDVFNFSNSNLVVSWIRTFKDGSSKIVNF